MYWFVLMAQVYTSYSSVPSNLFCVRFSVVWIKWVGRSVMIEVTVQTRVISNWARACCFLWRIGTQRGNIVYNTPLHVQTSSDILIRAVPLGILWTYGWASFAPPPNWYLVGLHVCFPRQRQLPPDIMDEDFNVVIQYTWLLETLTDKPARQRAIHSITNLSFAPSSAMLSPLHGSRVFLFLLPF